MNANRLYKILNECTVQLRKGEVVHTKDNVTTIDMMPSIADAQPDLIKVDMEFLVVGVHKAVAEQHRAELIELLNDYPQPARLAEGPSYIEVGAEIGDQGAAFQLFALGQVLGLWKVITPATLGMTGDAAKDMAGRGFIMISGYSPAVATTA